MSDWVSKELSASAKSLSDSRECFIEVCINNRSLFIIVYLYVSCHPRLPRQVNYIEKYGTALSLSLSLSVSVSLSLSPGVSQKTFSNVLEPCAGPPFAERLSCKLTQT